MTFDGDHGPVHAFDYPPTNPEANPPIGELPPYVVLVHGGPTAHVAGAASGKITYFTSRGIGVLDVNYGGSTGYGRAYRERLRGRWGIVDVDDVAAASTGLVAERASGCCTSGHRGQARPVDGQCWPRSSERTSTAPASRATASAMPGRWLRDTHDFEAHYLDGLIGPLPQDESVYVERSPLSKADRFRVPVLLLQGDEDEVVPPAQSEAIRDALAARGVPHAYVLYEGEGHGFRRGETIVDALEKELAFLGEVFGFQTPDVPAMTLD